MRLKVSWVSAGMGLRGQQLGGASAAFCIFFFVW